MSTSVLSPIFPDLFTKFPTIIFVKYCEYFTTVFLRKKPINLRTIIYKIQNCISKIDSKMNNIIQVHLIFIPEYGKILCYEIQNIDGYILPK